jgi:hypothetical protein
MLTTEIYDPESQAFSSGPAMILPRFSHSATPFHATNVTTKTTLDSSQNPNVFGRLEEFARVLQPVWSKPTGPEYTPEASQFQILRAAFAIGLQRSLKNDNA